MENQTTNTRETKPAVIGFALMLTGPAILFLASALQSITGNLPELLANIIAWICIILPGIGGVTCLVRLFFWKKIGSAERGLSIVTVIMCNPFFFFIYMFMCGMAAKTLAGLNWM